MPDDLYAQDIVVWSERQSALLRRLASGERVNELDWPHIIEEIEDVGGLAVRAVRSLLSRAIEHLLKLHGWPDNPAAEHWRHEARVFLSEAALDFTPGMRQLIDIDKLYSRAAAVIGSDTMQGEPPGALPKHNPFRLDDLIAEELSLDALLAQLRQLPPSSAA